MRASLEGVCRGTSCALHRIRALHQLALHHSPGLPCALRAQACTRTPLISSILGPAMPHMTRHTCDAGDKLHSPAACHPYTSAYGVAVMRPMRRRTLLPGPCLIAGSCVHSVWQVDLIYLHDAVLGVQCNPDHQRSRNVSFSAMPAHQRWLRHGYQTPCAAAQRRRRWRCTSCRRHRGRGCPARARHCPALRCTRCARCARCARSAALLQLRLAPMPHGCLRRCLQQHRCTAF